MGDKPLALRMLSSDEVGTIREKCLYLLSEMGMKIVQATALLIVIICVVANFIADIIYALLNPRIRYQ